MAERARHAFGKSENVSAALESGAIDAYDILFLDGDSKPKVGWIDKDGNVKVVDNECVIVVEDEAMPETGELGKVYIFADEGYFWNGTEFKPIVKSADLTMLEGQVADLETQMENKVDVKTVQTMIQEQTESAYEVIEF